ncbi:Transcription factor GTE10 [Acorus calamus]|uniref:Transcription factor GTE10 n=1 Tax=Acorus calamus TaxID=4465 RepID=A0AAV9DA92_ACOCL|nr:Transcription factor GTE10 [Acorus calamus]
MGGKAVEKKKKKKGRPSLLDLQKRSLRQQQQQQQELQEKQNPNPYIRNPNPNSTRRSTRRNPNIEPEAAEDDEDDDDEGGSKRREKKLKLVLRLPSGGKRGLDDGGSARSESDGGDDRRTKKRKVGDFGEDHKSERHNSASKATNAHPGEPSNSGPTTPLPDEKLLVFILDRLQKKDTYGVFSDPLPDYHEVIEHPMDFSTVRKKLSDGAYANLEQFENDVFLISSNAMRYNSPDTIYFRQARGIQELAEKNFENLRQDSDDEEPEPKVVRRGRPPSKNIIKRTVGRPPIDRASSDFSSNATLANAGDNGMWSNSSNDVLRRGAFLDKPGTSDVSTRYGLHNSDPYGWLMDGKPDKNDELTGSGMKGMSMKLAKKNIVIDENRRNTYKLAQQLSSGHEPSVLTTFEEEKKQLLPVGFHTEHAYARSLARFVVGLGPTAWNVASRKIQRSLPPGVKFGIGWVGEYEPPPSKSTHTVTLPQPPQPQLEPSCSQMKSSPSSMASHTTESHKDESVIPERHELSINPSTAVDIHSSRDTPPSLPTESNGNVRKLNYESGLGPLSSGGSGTRPKTPPQHFQLHQNPLLQTTPINGFNNGFGFNLNQVGNMGGPVGPGLSGFSRGGETMPTTHSRMLDMVSRGKSSLIHHQLHPSRLEVEKVNEPPMRPSTSLHHSQGLWRGLQQKQQQLNPGSAPPDLNVRFQTPSSPTPSSVVVDSQHPDLALQL